MYLTGSCVIATLKEERNCVSVEEDPVLYINSKVHVIDSGVGVLQNHPPKEQLETGVQNQQQQLDPRIEEETNLIDTNNEAQD